MSKLSGARIARIATVPNFLMVHVSTVIEELSKKGTKTTLICSPGPELEKLQESENVTAIPVEIVRKPAPLADMISL